TWAGSCSAQLPTPVLNPQPGGNYMLSATGVLNSSTALELSWGRAFNSLDFELQKPELFRTAGGFSSMPLLYPNAVQADQAPYFIFHCGRAPRVTRHAL